jgi:glycogen synthase
MTEQTALAGRMRGYLAELDKVVDRVILLAGKAIKSGDDGYWDGVALNLHSFYSGAEKIFEDIARTIDGNIPSGSDWHTGLLIQMMTESANRRPPVISSEVRVALDEYRGFRHVVRNVYAFNFRPSRLKELVDGLPKCYNPLKQELLAFAQFLESLDQKS